MIQSGKNAKYPEKIETWRKGETVPEWLGDQAKVIFIDGTGSLKIEIRTTNSTTGGYDIIRAGGGILVSAKNETDFICHGDGRIFSLTTRQVDLLYKKEERGN